MRKEVFLKIDWGRKDQDRREEVKARSQMRKEGEGGGK